MRMDVHTSLVWPVVKSHPGIPRGGRLVLCGPSGVHEVRPSDVLQEEYGENRRKSAAVMRRSKSDLGRKRRDFLDRMRTSYECPESWDGMEGDDRCRFCSGCQREVFDFAQMSPREIRGRLEAGRGKLCARLTRDGGGLVMLAPALPGLRPPRSSGRVSPLAATLLGAWLVATAENPHTRGEAIAEIGMALEAFRELAAKEGRDPAELAQSLRHAFEVSGSGNGESGEGLRDRRGFQPFGGGAAAAGPAFSLATRSSRPLAPRAE